jgi:hypothetical protein
LSQHMVTCGVAVDQAGNALIANEDRQRGRPGPDDPGLNRLSSGARAARHRRRVPQKVPRALHQDLTAYLAHGVR